MDKDTERAGRTVIDEIHDEVDRLRQTREEYAETTDDLRSLVDQLKEDRANL